MIRKFKESDLEKIMDIWLDSNIKEHSFISEKYWKIVSDYVKRAISLSEVYVYEDETTGCICGFAGIEDNYIAGLFVEEASRNNGIGKQLTDYIKTIRNELELKVYIKNEKAISFYQREQFFIDSESVDENTGEKEYIMKWNK